MVKRVRTKGNSKKLADKVKAIAAKRKNNNVKKNENEKLSPENFVSTGLTVLNLALSTFHNVGYILGRMINIIGDSSAGKCLKNGYLLTPNGMCDIADIGKDKDFDFTDWKIQLETSKNVHDTTDKFYKDTTTKTIEIKTKYGYSEEGTPEHKIMIFTPNCSFTMKRLDQLTKGDIAIIASDTQIFTFDYPKLPTHGIFEKKEHDYTSIIPNLPININKNIATLLGYFVADGNFVINSLRISNSKECCKTNMKNICKTLNVYSGQQGINNKILYKLFQNIFKQPKQFTAHFKFVPDIILQAPKDIQTAFIRALIDCDGSFDIKNQVVEYLTASSHLAKQIHLMLCNLGIVANHSEKDGAYIGDKFYDHIYHRILIGRQYITKYTIEIGSDCYDFSNIAKPKHEKSDACSIPFLKNKMMFDINALKIKLGWSKNGILKDGSRFPRIKWTTINGITFNFLNTFIKTFKDYPIDLSFYQTIQNSGYYFDPIISTKKKKHKIPIEVYDVHIPKSHKFWCNGFINHNSILAWLCFAEVCLDPRFKDYDLYYDDTEDGGDGFNVPKLFGKKTEKRVILLRSDTIQEFHYNWLKCFKKGRKFIYIVDSIDGLDDKADQKKLEEARLHHESRSKKKLTGSFGMSKPKYAHRMFRDMTGKLRDTDSLLICISQTKYDPNATQFQDPKYRTCGPALEFFAWMVIWLGLGKEHKDKELMIGVESRAKCSKNRSTGKRRQCHFPIYYDIGPDDIRSCIEFLIEIGYWKKNRTGVVDADDFGIELTVKKLILEIENENLEDNLRQLVADAWNKREAAVKIDNRKKRYI